MTLLGKTPIFGISTESKHRFSSNIADIPKIQWWISKSSGFMQKSLSVKKSYSHIAHCTWNIVSIRAALWSCISNPIRPDNLGCVGSHYNQQQEHREHNLIFLENYDLRWWRVGELRENTFHQIICIAFKIGTEYRGHVNICVLGENIDIWKLLTFVRSWVPIR